MNGSDPFLKSKQANGLLMVRFRDALSVFYLEPYFHNLSGRPELASDASCM